MTPFRLPIQPPYAVMDAELVHELPRGGEWQYEPKWEGFRRLAFRAGGRIELVEEMTVRRPGGAIERLREHGKQRGVYRVPRPRHGMAMSMATCAGTSSRTMTYAPPTSPTVRVARSAWPYGSTVTLAQSSMAFFLTSAQPPSSLAMQYMSRLGWLRSRLTMRKSFSRASALANGVWSPFTYAPGSS